MRGFHRRGLRLQLVAAIGLALATFALAPVAASATGIATTTTVAAQSSQSGTCSLTSLTVKVASASGIPAGTVDIEDQGGSNPGQIGSASLDPTGQATFVFALPNGAQNLTAVYTGNATYQTSTSTSAAVTVSSQCSQAYTVAVSSLSPSNTLTAGQTGIATVSVVPLQGFVASLSAPAFVTLSCSGLPDQASCSFTPENVEISPSQYGAVTSSMYILTQAEGTASLVPRPSNAITWAFLLPGALGLGGIAWASRRRPWLNRLSLLALVTVITALGTTGCNPRYNYEHHGPVINPPTPPGTYTVTVTAQSSNGITAITNSTTMTLTVQ